MGMDHLLSSFLSELEKIAVSTQVAGYPQTRAGRRSIRASNLLKKEPGVRARREEKEDGLSEPEEVEVEHGLGMGDAGEKLAAQSRKDEALQAAVNARPWVKSFAQTAIPSAVAANFLIPATKTPWLERKSKAVATLGMIGGGLGVADRYLKNWARKNKRSKAAKEVLRQVKEGSVKEAALGGDLRRNGIGGVKRPPFPTEDSKRHSFSMLRNARQPGLFTAKTEAKNLMKPGPSISQVTSV